VSVAKGSMLFGLGRHATHRPKVDRW